MTLLTAARKAATAPPPGRREAPLPRPLPQSASPSCDHSTKEEQAILSTTIQTGMPSFLQRCLSAVDQAKIALWISSRENEGNGCRKGFHQMRELLVICCVWRSRSPSSLSLSITRSHERSMHVLRANITLVFSSRHIHSQPQGTPNDRPTATATSQLNQLQTFRLLGDSSSWR